MNSFSWLSRFLPLQIISLFYLGISVLLRLVLWKIFGQPAQVSWTEMPSILGAGVLNDCITLVFLNIPAVIYLTCMPDKPACSRRQKGWFLLLVFLTLFGLICLAEIEFFFFWKFDTRFSLIDVDYLISLRNILTPIWHPDSIVIFILISGLTSALFLMKLQPFLVRAFEYPADFKPRIAFLAAYVLLALPVLWISSDEFNISDNDTANELSHNGISSLFRAFNSRSPDDNFDDRSMDYNRRLNWAKKQKRLLPPTQSKIMKTSADPPARSDRGKKSDMDRQLPILLKKMIILSLFSKGSP
ncbi:hypothetical protein ACTVJH_12940 [Desulfoplanes sp. PS50]|jgi:hypothetical protein